MYISSESFIEECDLTVYGDILFDNVGDNIIACHAGDDFVSTSFGYDIIDGGDGFDHVSIYGSADEFFLSQSNGDYYELVHFGDDRVIGLDNVEEISFFDDTNRVSEVFLIENFVGADQSDVDTDPGYESQEELYYVNMNYENFVDDDWVYYATPPVDEFGNITSGLEFRDYSGQIFNITAAEIYEYDTRPLHDGKIIHLFTEVIGVERYQIKYRVFDLETNSFVDDSAQLLPGVDEFSMPHWVDLREIYDGKLKLRIDDTEANFSQLWTFEWDGEKLSNDGQVVNTSTDYISNYEGFFSSGDNFDGGFVNLEYVSITNTYSVTDSLSSSMGWRMLDNGHAVVCFVEPNANGFDDIYMRVFDRNTQTFLSEKVKMPFPEEWQNMIYADGNYNFGIRQLDNDLIQISFRDGTGTASDQFFYNVSISDDKYEVIETFATDPVDAAVFPFNFTTLPGDHSDTLVFYDHLGQSHTVATGLSHDGDPSNGFETASYELLGDGHVVITYFKENTDQNAYEFFYRVFDVKVGDFVTKETQIGKDLTLSPGSDIIDWFGVWEMADGFIDAEVYYTDESGSDRIVTWLIEKELDNVSDLSGQSTILGADADFFIGDAEADYVETGGGDDQIMSAGGDDYVVVQGTGNVTVDTGEGEDTVQVDANFTGTLFVKGSNAEEMYIDQATGAWNVDQSGVLTIQLLDDSVITVDEYLTFDEASGMYVLTGPTVSILSSDIYELGFGDMGLTVVRGSSYTDDLLYSASYDANLTDDIEPKVDEETLYTVSGWGGNDVLYGGSGTQQLFGGSGDDVFYISAVEQDTIVTGDRWISSTESSDGSILPDVVTENISYADVVKIGWSYEDSIIEAVGAGYRIENVDLGAVVEVYDVELLKFLNEDGSWDDRALTDGAPVDINANYGNGIKFVVSDGDTIQVLEAGKKGDRVLWEGNRLEVDAFNFGNGVSINVINISDADVFDNPIVYTMGTEGVDLIFGNDSDNLIDGKGGDDIIFGGGGNDVIIGGEGDDVITGGDGDDIIRGDGVDVDDAAVAYFEDADVSGDSLSASDMITDGNDTIIGGDGVDDIESGNGENFVASGRVDLDGDVCRRP